MERLMTLGCELEDARAALSHIKADIGERDRPARPTEEATISALTAKIGDLEREQRHEREQHERNLTAPAVNWPAGEKGRPSVADDDDAPAVALPKLPARTRRTLAAMAGGGTMTTAAKSEHFRAVVAAALGGNPLHPALLPMASGNEAVGPEGGFAVVDEVAAGIFTRAAEESVFMRIGARVETMKSDSKTVVALDDDDESADAEASLKAAWTAENVDAGTPQVMKIRAVELKAHKLMVLAALSNELADDAEGLVAEYEAAIGRAIGKRFDRLILSGSGAGQPQGLLSAAATIQVSKTVDGDPGLASTFTWNHAAGMWSRLAPGSHERAWWLISPSVLPQALSMSVRVKNAAGAEYVGGFQPLGGFTAGGPTGYMLLGRPVVVTGRAKALGTRGDVLLVDPTQLAIGIRRNITIDRSPHALFSSDQLAIRGKFRGDALALWDAPRTLQEGSITVSPYVVLEAR